MKSFGAVSKRFQAIAVELANYSKESLDNQVATTEKFMGAKSLEKAFEVQSEYVKTVPFPKIISGRSGGAAR